MIYIFQIDLRINGVFTGKDGWNKLMERFREFAEISMNHSTSYRTRFGPHDPIFFNSDGADIGDLKASKYTDTGDWAAFTPEELGKFRSILIEMAKKYDVKTA